MEEKMTPGQPKEEQLPCSVTSETIINFRRWGAVAFRIPPPGSSPEDSQDQSREPIDQQIVKEKSDTLTPSASEKDL